MIGLYWSIKLRITVLGLCDGGAIEIRQPNPCTKAKLEN